jgi:hypothetical protein
MLGDGIHAYLDCKIVSVQQLMDIASLITEMLRKSTCVIDCAHCINNSISSTIFTKDISIGVLDINAPTEGFCCYQ